MTLSKAAQKKLRELDEKMTTENRNADFRRARALSVGTAFGGVTELSMRGNDGNVLWAILQPVEVVELIHQLAANIGCHIHVQPRKDFASWRDWKYTEEELTHYRGVQPLPGVGHPPHVNDMKPHMRVGMKEKPDVAKLPGWQHKDSRSESDEQTVATQKTVGRKRAKRAATPA